MSGGRDETKARNTYPHDDAEHGEQDQADHVDLLQHGLHGLLEELRSVFEVFLASHHIVAFASLAEGVLGLVEVDCRRFDLAALAQGPKQTDRDHYDDDQQVDKLHVVDLITKNESTGFCN